MKRFGRMTARPFALAALMIFLAACSATHEAYHDPIMDFGAIRTVAVLPFANFTSDRDAGERVRDVFVTSLLATGAVYVQPAGEVARGLNRARPADLTAPCPEEVKRLAGIIEADALFTGVLREYQEVRSGSTSAPVISLSMQMIETKTGRVIWSASSTKGGIGISERLFGGGGRPMNEVTCDAVDDMIRKLFM